MLWVLEIPVLLLGILHSKKLAAMAVGLYGLFCLWFGRKREVPQNWLRFPQLPFLAMVSSALLGVRFCRSWLQYAHTLPTLPGCSPQVTVIAASILLAVLSVPGVDVVILCLAELVYRLWKSVESPLRRALSVLYSYRWTVFLPVFATLFACNFLFLREGFACPDGVAEGLILYEGASWATSLGRWAVRFVNLATGNIVLHGLSFLVSGISVSIAAVLCIRLLRLRRTPSVIFTGVVLASALTVSFQYLYPYLINSYSVSLLFSALSAFLILEGTPSKERLAGAALCLLLSMASYQAYLSFCCTLILISLLLRLLEGEDLHSVLKTACYALGMGVCTGVVYLVSVKASCWFFSAPLSGYGGLNGISIKSILFSLPLGLLKCWLWFFTVLFSYFVDYGVLAGLPVLAVLLEVWWLYYRRENRRGFALACLCGLLLPVSMNTTTLLAPAYEFVTPLMGHAVYLLFPLLFALLERAEESKKKNLLRVVAFPVVALFCVVCLLTDNAMHYSTAYIAKYDIGVMEDVRAQVGEMETTDRNTRVFFAGYPASDELLRQNPLLNQTIFQFRTAMCWAVEDGAASNWDRFSTAYLGWHTGRFTPEEKDAILNLPELEKMPCYPKQGSIRAVDGNIVVVKFEETPYHLSAWLPRIEGVLEKLGLM